ncbi:MAG: DUF47 family protein [Magnetococcus sp. MYC-9]
MSGSSTNSKTHALLNDGPPPSLMSRFLENIFPKVPDFFGLLDDQCEVMTQCMEAMEAFMESQDEQKATLIRELEKRGDEIKARNLAILAKAFATPLDREDIYRAITSIDMILNYAKTTVREMEALQLAPDAHMLAMVRVMKKGTDALQRGFAKLSFDPLGAVEDEQAVHASEHEVETCYREALADMFDATAAAARKKPANPEEAVEARLIEQTIDIFKHRELYRHLSNLGDHVAIAGTVLYDIMVQV